MAIATEVAPTMRFGGSGRWSALYGAGMALVFLGERIIGAGGSRTATTLAGLVALVAAMVVRLVRLQTAAPDRQKVERSLLWLYGLGLLSLVFYFMQSDLPTLRGGKPLESSFPKLAVALAALWPAVWIAAMWPIALIEMSYAQMARAPRLEVGRVRDALFSGLGLAGALVFAFTAAYVSSERDKKFDFAYFKTTRPGETTRKIVKSLDQAVEVVVFFPASNEVREQVVDYLTDLGKESAQLKVSYADFDINPVKAKEMGVSGNGILVFSRGGRKEQLGLPVQFEAARGQLRMLDREVQQRLLMVVKPNRVTFIVQGHQERSYESTPETDKRAGIKDLRDLLLDQGHDVRPLGPAEGLGVDIPKDATLLVVAGPQKPFQPEEVAAINRYMDKGGRLLLALDPEAGLDQKEILAPFGLKYHPVMLANDQAFARRTHQLSDRTNLITGQYSVHPSVTSLQKLGFRAPVIMPSAGWLEPIKDRAKDISIESPITAHHQTFEDKNGNYEPDQGEDRRGWELTAAGSKSTARIFVLADSDSISDAVLRYGGNGLMVLDVVRWLIGEEGYIGTTANEADVPISHTRKQDVAWFYSSIFLTPALVLGIGFIVTRRKKKAAAPDAAAAAAATKEGGQS